MEVRRTRGESAQNRPLGLADVRTVSADQRSARIRDVKCLSGKRTSDALQCEDRQSGYIECRRAGICISYSDVQRRLDRVISDVWRVVAGTATTRKRIDVQYVVDTSNAGNVYQLGIKDCFAPCHRLSISGLWAVSGQVRPVFIQVKNVGAERGTAWIHPQRIVDADKEVRQQLCERVRPASLRNRRVAAFDR